MNIILATDGYKPSMPVQYPGGTQFIYDYVESRAGGRFKEIMFIGVQAFTRKYLSSPITQADIDEAKAVFATYGAPFYSADWEYILEKHNGYLPIEIKAIPEGTVCKPGIPVVTVVNTDPACFWLVTHIETALLRAIWYMSTVATISYEIKQDLIKAMKTSCDSLDKLPFMLHDFGARGVSSAESASLGGLAHLANFMGTDTIEALIAAKRFYDADAAGGTIPAMEHSTVTTWGVDGEVDAFRNMLRKYGKPGALLACVSDSYDLENAVANIWGEELKAEVINSGAMVVIRPDSGDAVTNITFCLEMLASKFGYDLNTKGYKVLRNVRLIQGDGVDRSSIKEITDAMLRSGWSLDNIAFGMGGALLQHCDRDWGRWAMKCSAIKIKGKWNDVYKQPKTDPSKASKRGRFKVSPDFEVVDINEPGDNLLQTVYKDGELFNEVTLDDIRVRSMS